MTNSTPSSGSTLPPVEIREAVSGDIPQLCKLLADLFSQETDFTPDSEKQQRALRLLLDSPQTARVYCASRSDSIVGMVTLLFTISTAEGGRTAWLEDMVVRADSRGQGIGRRLLNRAIEGAKASGCSRVTLLTDATNHDAIRFYTHAGFVQSEMVPLRLSVISRTGTGGNPPLVT